MDRSSSRVCLFLVGFLLLAAGSPGVAQHAGVQALPPGFTPWPGSPAGPWRWQSAAALASHPDSAWAECEEARSGDWRVMIHPVLGTPTWILTGGIELGAAPLDDGPAAVALVREVVERYRRILGVDRMEDLVYHRSAATPNPVGHSILGVEFRQTYRGYDVRSATDHLRVKFTIDATLGRLSAMGSDWIPGLACPVRPIPRDAAETIAREEIPPFAPGRGRVFAFRTYVLVEPDPRSETERTARLVHHVSFEIDEPSAAWSVLMDANTGSVLRKHSDRVHVDVIGNVAAGTLEDGPFDAFKVVPMRSLQVNVVGGGSGVTDAGGNFQIAHSGSAPVTVGGRFAGDWCTVYNQAGADTSFSVPATPGQAANVVMNPQHVTEYMTAEATAYRFVNEAHFFVARRYPSYAGMPRLTTNVNISNTCNAFYQNNTINFFKSGVRGSNNCANTAYEEVIAHEYGHGFHVVFHGSYQPLDFSEGIGDHLGLYVSDQRVLGRDFFNKGQPVRDYTLPVAQGGAQDRQWKDPACSNQSHCLGQAWAGCAMDLRDLLIQKHGPTQGRDVSEIITIAQYSRNPADIQDAVLQTFIQDDNDANLKNGTPNFKQIAQAADNHGIPRPPDPPTVQFKHTPYPDTRDTVNPYRIVAEVTSQAGVVTSALLGYSTGTAPVTTLAMAKIGPDLYAADIPPRPAVSRVSYYLEGKDDKNNHERWPIVGTFDFTVGQLQVFFADDFEVDRGWSVVSTATAGRFERADPIGMTWTGNPRGDCQPEDDATPGTGTHCFVTENGQRGREEYLFDVDNGDTEIRSPTFDLSAIASGAARLRYARWFYTYNNDDDTLDVEVSTDDGKSWKSVEQVTRYANSWTRVEMPLPGPYTDRMKIRFRTGDNPNNSVTDALVDDVSVVVFTDDVAELTADSATPAIGTTLNYGIAAAKRPGALYYWAISLTPGPTETPGIGRHDLGVPFHLIRGGVLDSSGKDGFPVPIPNVAALRGTKFYTEALVFKGDIILTNPWNVQIK